MTWLEQKRIDWLERSVVALRDLAGRRDLPAHLATGIEGERAAAFCLRRKGYTVVATRWSSRLERGDLDLIAWQGELLCFVEVKTRTAHDMAAAEAAVDFGKRTTVRRLARRYVQQLPGSGLPPVRFDVLSVYLIPGEPQEFVHFEGAFGWNEGDDWDWR